MSLALGGDLAFQLGFGGAAGFVVGFAIKKLLKVLLIFLGLFFVAMQYLAYQGFISIDYERFASMFDELARNPQGIPGVPAFLTANIPFGASFAMGLAFGLYKG